VEFTEYQNTLWLEIVVDESIDHYELSWSPNEECWSIDGILEGWVEMAAV